MRFALLTPTGRATPFVGGHSGERGLLLHDGGFGNPGLQPGPLPADPACAG